MDFLNGQIYHVFNRGNYSQTVFFSSEDYLFFLSKIEEYLKPHANVLAWCLMPNHFDLMIRVEKERLERIPHKPARKKYKSSPIIPTYSCLNYSISSMLRTYTQAVNSEDQKSGPLFHQPTKVLCLSDPQFDAAYFKNHFGNILRGPILEKDYLYTCFKYIHHIPVKGKFVDNPEDWEFSSYRDYFSGREGTLVNRELAKELGIPLKRQSPALV